MLTSVAAAAQALAIWRVAEHRESSETDRLADFKAAEARAHEMFVQAAYQTAFELVPHILAYGDMIVVHSEVCYLATMVDGGLVRQQMDIDSPSIYLVPGTASTQSFLQFMIDLPDILGILQIKEG